MGYIGRTSFSGGSRRNRLAQGTRARREERFASTRTATAVRVSHSDSVQFTTSDSQQAPADDFFSIERRRF